MRSCLTGSSRAACARSAGPCFDGSRLSAFLPSCLQSSESGRRCEQSFQRKQLQAVEQSVNRELDKLEDRLVAATSGAELDDILIRLGELENTARDSRGAKAS